ncbi:2Fe-2S iron-sulfur cluster binding domain-containing protein [Balneolaceae bacterium YR4-1]|uniref:2Fe-2S iron-sulfur cluster binding domain-containing protein n=1 Tax=Halalkalibaculum roseum TaxID=2709311 RepID=A0A6M1SYE2_9BACT|nr:2Fe-2S iron-sulfur cluster-binding protein [Halalkalibaculum roseum]NGP76204.1 2Fe-2S iron-sulfur cluster binding domain-containing protein [Halalkalibaculum roseum]
MPEVFIDGKRYEFEGDHMALQYMLDQGLEVPFFCYHPSMSIPANCRQCMVKAGQYMKNDETGEYELDEEGERKIRWFPKLQTSCALKLSDGMVIQTQETSDEAERAQKDTLEFILANHPLDCPICDQAGECPLQIQTYKYGPEGSRFEVKKVHKPKRVELGPRVTLDAERCINCTRCVRFTEEISESHQLTIVSRGDKNYPITAPSETFDDPYSLNTVDICPVGALTSTDFRFKARVWEMNQTPSIDISNGKGCNVDLWTRDNEVLRITPRQNDHVNDYWMPDESRNAYKLFNENRVSRPFIKLDGDNQSNSSWNNAIETFAEVLEANDSSDILLIGSPHASVEENYTFNKFFNLLGAPNARFATHIIDGYGDDFLITDDQAPNTSGCRLLNLDESSSSELKTAVSQAKVVITLGDDLIDRDVLSVSDLEDPYVVSLATNHNEMTKASDLVIPITCVAEHAASYVNIDGRIQRSFPAKETKYSNRRLNLEMSEGRLDRFGTNFDNWVNEDNKVDCLPVWEFLNKLAERLGLEFEYRHSREIMTEISEKLDTFADVSFERMDEEKGIQLPIKQSKVEQK